MMNVMIGIAIVATLSAIAFYLPPTGAGEYCYLKLQDLFRLKSK